MRQLIILCFLLYISIFLIPFFYLNEWTIIFLLIYFIIGGVFIIGKNMLHPLFWKYLLFSKNFEIDIFKNIMDWDWHRVERYFNEYHSEEKFN